MNVDTPSEKLSDGALWKMRLLVCATLERHVIGIAHTLKCLVDEVGEEDTTSGHILGRERLRVLER